eukprot:TRINITY_DN1548_c0_g1_i1.p1 TRINITY_DN1548_c0_g1~~TRINITY_DN1548_c0_g1_i1.p1  ORF type:complete len:229 (-),score=83.12 TRINITY_DN1548_c0_g1_i1:67-699(-)
MAAQLPPLFELTSKFRSCINMINSVDTAKLPLILIRIAQTLHLKEERSFNEVEQEKLQQVTGLSETDVQLLIDGCSFILEQAAYYNVAANGLAHELKTAGLNQDKCAAFMKVWESEREKIVVDMREQTIQSKVLDSVNWSMHLQMSQTIQSKMKSPSVILEFTTKSSNTNNLEKKLNENENFKIEFNHQQLFDFFQNLDKIQQQLDGLSF